MIRRSLLLSLLLAASAGGVSAQVDGAPAFAQGEFLGIQMEQLRREMNPAAQLLAHRTELELTTAQAAELESLSAPMDRFLEQALVPQINPASLAVLMLMADPSDGPVDDEGIRAAFREQADSQAEMIIRMARIDRDVNRVLTPEQKAKRVSLKINSPFGIMRDLANTMMPAQ
jgi:Spy/CpxP family protein refolding chaperone